MCLVSILLNERHLHLVVFVNWKFRCSQKYVLAFRPTWATFITEWISLLKNSLTGPGLPLSAIYLNAFHGTLVAFRHSRKPVHLALCPAPPPPTPPPSKVQLKAARRQARKIELAVQVEDQLFDYVAHGFGPVWIDGSAQLSEWTNVVVTVFGIFSESVVSVALPLDTQLPHTITTHN